MIDRPRQISLKLLVLLAGLGALGSMAIHMVVPALPTIARDMESSEATMQAALTLYLIALGCGQLLAGPASDIFGRRPILLGGAALFTLGSLGAVFSGGATVLVAARIVQGLGGAAGIVAARAVVSDLTDARLAAGRLAMLTTVVLISPAISPIVGGILTSAWGWRSIFVTLALLGSCASFFALRWVRESNSGVVLKPNNLLSAYARLLGNDSFRRYCLTMAAASCTLYLFLAGSSFMLNRHYGLTPDEAGLCYFLIACAAIAGTLLVGKLERSGVAIRAGVCAIGAGGASMLFLALLGFEGLASLLGPMVLVALGGGIVVPAGMAGAMHAEEGLAATASSLAGALQMSATGMVATLAAQLHRSSLLALAVGICTAGMIAALAAPRGATFNGDMQS
jgi:DHA1 family bicyclomycin/chloramphenicol resistance-like MFS transporter